MGLLTTLADELMERHPERAAAVFERHAVADAAALLARVDREASADVLRRLSPQRATAALESLPRDAAAEILHALELDTAARLVRRLDAPVRDELLARLDERRAGSLRALLRFPAHTAGGLMDPEVLALPLDLSAAEALALVREQPEQARYNLYAVDGEQRLVGALNLRELLLAAPSERLADLMVSEPSRLLATADRATVVSHPGWREVHALPVVDETGHYLGAIRYRTLRELEDELLRGRDEDHGTAEALGELFAAGAAGLLDALAPIAAERGDRAR